MFGDVFSSLAAAFSEQFGGPYAEAVARWQGTPTKDSGGSITAAGTPVERACRVQFDTVTEAMRASPDFLQTDVRLLVLGLASLDTSAQIVVSVGERAGTWVLRSCDRDAAGIGYDCRGRLL